MNQPTPYADLNAVLAELVSSVRGALGDTFVGAYLQGSFAVGDFDQHSDVDFIIAIRDDLSNARVAELQAIHQRVYHLGSEWAKHLEGSYFTLAVLRHREQCGTPLWYLDHGSRSLVRSNHCNTMLVRQVVRPSPSASRPTQRTTSGRSNSCGSSSARRGTSTCPPQLESKPFGLDRSADPLTLGTTIIAAIHDRGEGCLMNVVRRR